MASALGSFTIGTATQRGPRHAIPDMSGETIRLGRSAVKVREADVELVFTDAEVLHG
jgi:hypothetical protein